MPSRLRTRSPQLRRAPQLLPVEDMTGGLDLRRSPTLMSANRARQLLNVSLEEPGAWTVRAGYTAASSASFGANPTGGQRVYLSSRVFTLMAMDGSVYKPTDAWVQGSAVYSTISTANQAFFPHDRDLVAVFDGANRPRMSTDGSTWVLMGIDAPSSGPAVSSGSSGDLSTGEYAFAYTFKHRGTAHESSISPESTYTIVNSTHSIQLVFDASTDAKVDARVWYGRHKVPDGETVLRKISSGSSGTIVITSSNWTANDPAPLNHGVPPTGLKFAAVWKNRWWAPDQTQGNRLWFTELFQPQSWPSDFYIDIPFDKGDAISAVQPVGDTLHVYGQSGIYLVIGQTSLDFEVRPFQGTTAGAYGPRATAQVEQASVHVSAVDVASNDGATDRSLGFDIQPAIRDLSQNTDSTTLSKVASVYDDLEKELRISVPRVYPTGAKGELVMNLNRTRENEGAPAWTTTDRDVAFYVHWNGNEPTAGNRGRLFTIASTGGLVYEENSSNSGANSSNLTAQYEGPAISLGIHAARITGTYLEVERRNGAFSVELVVDGVSQGSQPVDIGSGLARYGSAVYGTDEYAASARLTRWIPQPLSAEGRTAVMKGTYAGKETFKWFTYTHTVVPDTTPRRM